MSCIRRPEKDCSLSQGNDLTAFRADDITVFRNASPVAKGSVAKSVCESKA